jgi:hypothetical protein
LARAGSNSAAKMAMIAITTSSSISVKARLEALGSTSEFRNIIGLIVG